MNTVYTIIMTVHVIAAIAFIGPVFLLQRFLAGAGHAGQLRYQHSFARRLDRMIDRGMAVQLITGLLMGWIEPSLFRMVWFDVSIVLVAIAGLYMNFVARPRIKPLYDLIDSHPGDEVPGMYKKLWSQAAPYIIMGQVIILGIILLMVLKP